jgi:small subunit ribosomal protein S6
MESDAASKIATDYKNLIESNKGKVSLFKEMGQKKLAYAIEKQITGFYYCIDFEATTDVVKELDRRLGLDENVLRHLIVRNDEE